MAGERRLERLAASEAGVHCPPKQLGIPKRVGNALRRGRVEHVARIADQCPPRAEGLAKEVGQISGAVTS